MKQEIAANQWLVFDPESASEILREYGETTPKIFAEYGGKPAARPPAKPIPSAQLSEKPIQGTR